MAVQIGDIQIYRDGGSISFRVERDGAAKRVWLETPFKGEPRALLVDGAEVLPDSQVLAELLRDIDEWHTALTESQRRRVEEVLQTQSPHRNPSDELLHDIALSRVVVVQRYLRGDFLQPRKPPPITDELRAEAKRQPNGWVYVVDPELMEGECMPPAAIVGVWKVDAEGNVVEDAYQPNPRYKGSH